MGKTWGGSLWVVYVDSTRNFGEKHFGKNRFLKGEGFGMGRLASKGGRK